MNIFWLDNDINKCAEYHCDKHVVKMILEYTQLLCTSHHVLGTELASSGKLYRKTHVNHPCAVWARSSSHSFLRLLDLAEALCAEYTHRYGKVHKSQAVIELIRSSPPAVEPRITRDIPIPPLCMPDECKTLDTVESYRNYYRVHKAPICKWTDRPVPEWFSK